MRLIIPVDLMSGATSIVAVLTQLERAGRGKAGLAMTFEGEESITQAVMNICDQLGIEYYPAAAARGREEINREEERADPAVSKEPTAVGTTALREKPEMEKTCEICGEVFRTNNRNRKICLRPECKKEQKKRYNQRYFSLRTATEEAAPASEGPLAEETVLM